MKKISVLLSLLFCGFAYAATETINWYVDNNVYDTTTCESGDDVILPTPPTPPYGYTFHGWAELLLYDMSTLDTSIHGDVYYAHTATTICQYRTYNAGVSQQQACTLSDYSDLALREWKVQFSYGWVRGEAACSATAGTAVGEVGNPDLSDPVNGGKYCWCRVTGFIPVGESVVYTPIFSSWAFRSEMSISPYDCATYCADHCGGRVLGNSLLRAGLYGL